MLISRITKNNKNILIILENGEQVSIRYEVFLQSSIRKGDELSDKQIANLLVQNQSFLAKEQAYRFLSVRIHSSKEIELKLQRKKFNKEITSKVIKELLDLGFLDDNKFAMQYLEEKRKYKKSGARKIRQELISKGISISTADSVLSEGDKETEIDNALYLARKKMNILQTKSLDSKKLKQKLYNYLLSKGFDYDTSIKAIASVAGKDELEN